MIKLNAEIKHAMTSVKPLLVVSGFGVSVNDDIVVIWVYHLCTEIKKI